MPMDTKTKQEKIDEIKRADANVKTMEDFTSPDKLYQELIAGIRQVTSVGDISLIEKAYKTAYEAHKVRSGSRVSPYIIIRCAWRSFWRIWSSTKRRSLRDFCMMSLRTRS